MNFVQNANQQNQPSVLQATKQAKEILRDNKYMYLQFQDVAVYLGRLFYDKTGIFDKKMLLSNGRITANCKYIFNKFIENNYLLTNVISDLKQFLDDIKNNVIPDLVPNFRTSGKTLHVLYRILKYKLSQLIPGYDRITFQGNYVRTVIAMRGIMRDFYLFNVQDPRHSKLSHTQKIDNILKETNITRDQLIVQFKIYLCNEVGEQDDKYYGY
jgi:hypothetical protein